MEIPIGSLVAVVVVVIIVMDVEMRYSPPVCCLLGILNGVTNHEYIIDKAMTKMQVAHTSVHLFLPVASK